MTTAADPHIYPAPRKGRGAGAALEDLGPIVAPRTRLFPFFFTYTANARRSFSTPRLVGPLLIQSLAIYRSGGSSPPVQTLELGKSTVPVTEANVPLATPRPYTVLTELLNNSTTMLPAAGGGFPLHSTPNTHVEHEFRVNMVVTDPETFIVLALVNNSLGVAEFAGHMTILEGLNPDALRFFQ